MRFHDWLFLGYVIASVLCFVWVWASCAVGKQAVKRRPIEDAVEEAPTNEQQPEFEYMADREIPLLSLEQKAFMTALLHDFCAEHPQLMEEALKFRERALDDQIAPNGDLSGVMAFLEAERIALRVIRADPSEMVRASLKEQARKLEE